jgi:hypothetical protein
LGDDKADSELMKYFANFTILSPSLAWREDSEIGILHYDFVHFFKFLGLQLLILLK